MPQGKISNKNTTMSFVIPKDLKEEFGKVAAEENRSMSNLIVVLIESYVNTKKRQKRLEAYSNELRQLGFNDKDKYDPLV